MRFRTMINLLLVLVFLVSGFCYSEEKEIPSDILEKYKNKPENDDKTGEKTVGIADINSAEQLIRAVNKHIESVKTYNAHVEYLFEQPLFESSTLRKGRIYFIRGNDANSDRLAVDFRTVKQDDQDQQLHRERYIFDGVWLTHIDYKLKQIEKRQLARPNEPADVFELASGSFPVVGFSKFGNLGKNFALELKKSKKRGVFHLVMKVKEGSDYDDYEKVKVWISRKTLLPEKIIAFTKDNDVYNMRFFAPDINGEIPERVFDTEPPPGFPEPRVVKYSPENTEKKKKGKKEEK